MYDLAVVRWTGIACAIFFGRLRRMIVHADLDLAPSVRDDFASGYVQIVITLPAGFLTIQPSWPSPKRYPFRRNAC